jgi:glutathione synthase/RimK-type ligase-like ATP-grasp enzyme
MKEKGLEDLLPEFWTEAGSIPDEAFPVVCRTVLSGHSGAGIYIADTRDDLVHAPLYVKYVKKKEEYRIHVAGGEVISVQRKAKRVGVTPTCYQVRNLANGFVYVRDSIEPPVQCLESAVKVVQALELTFGAVDVIWNQHYQRAFVLEVNTAPGLEGRTVTDYATFFVENFS